MSGLVLRYNGLAREFLCAINGCEIDSHGPMTPEQVKRLQRRLRAAEIRSIRAQIARNRFDGPDDDGGGSAPQPIERSAVVDLIAA